MASSSTKYPAFEFTPPPREPDRQDSASFELAESSLRITLASEGWLAKRGDGMQVLFRAEAPDSTEGTTDRDTKSLYVREVPTKHPAFELCVLRSSCGTTSRTRVDGTDPVLPSTVKADLDRLTRGFGAQFVFEEITGKTSEMKPLSKMKKGEETWLEECGLHFTCMNSVVWEGISRERGLISV